MELDPRLLPKSLVFRLHRARYFSAAGLRVVPAAERIRDAVEKLDRDGVAVFPGYMDRDVALALGSRLREKAAQVAADSAQTEHKVYKYDDIGLIRVLRAEKLDAEAAGFFDDPFIADVAKSYTSENSISWQRMFEVRSSRPVFGPSDLYHIDEAFYFKFKAFLYLSDVTAETAPYTYLRGSHRDAPWRREKGRQILTHDIYGPDSVYGVRGNFFEDRERDYLKAKCGYEEIVCQGAAGTLILTDTRGVHKATTPVTGGRTMLGHYFELPRKNIWPRVKKNTAATYE
jgi:hypothetical protein